MDKDEIRKRIDHLQGQIQQDQDTREAFIAAVQRSDLEALSELQGLRDSLVALQGEVPEAYLLRTDLLERSGVPRDERSIESVSLWHSHTPSPDPDFSRPLSPRLHTDLLSMITYDPLREEWRCERLTGDEITPAVIIAAYTDRLVEWVVRVYPSAKRRREEADQASAAQAQRAEEKAIREAEFDTYIAGTPNAMAFGCLGIVAGIVVLLVVLNLLVGAQFR